MYRTQVLPYRYGQCFLVFDAKQRHMTKAVNLTEHTECYKIGFFFATEESMAQAAKAAEVAPSERASRMKAREQRSVTK